MHELLRLNTPLKSEGVNTKISVSYRLTPKMTIELYRHKLEKFRLLESKEKR